MHFFLALKQLFQAFFLGKERSMYCFYRLKAFFACFGQLSFTSFKRYSIFSLSILLPLLCLLRMKILKIFELLIDSFFRKCVSFCFFIKKFLSIIESKRYSSVFTSFKRTHLLVILSISENNF